MQNSQPSTLISAPTVADVTTVFTESGTVAEESLGFTPKLDDMVVKNQSLSDFLAKPILIQQGTWTTATAQNGNLFSFSPGALLATNPIWANKLSGYAYGRGNAVVRVQINANPFQQGRLFLHFLPCQPAFAAVDASYLAIHNTIIASKIQQPNVELDCRDSACTMSVPYLTPVNWYNFKTTSYDWGTFYLDVLSPLATGETGDVTVDYSVWLHFEDFEFAGPTLPQMAGKGGKRFRVASLTKEEAKMEGGPISNGLSVAAKVSGALSAVPILAPLTGPASWLLSTASGVAGAFGWSKPESRQGGSIMIPMYNRYSATSDGLVPDVPLGLVHDNATSISTSNSIRSEDEMSFNFLKQVPVLTKTVAWTDTQISGTSLLAANMGPNGILSFQQATRTVGIHVVTYNVGGPMYYLAQRFRLWRGSICLVVKLVKTQYHTGRLQVSFTPGNVTTALVGPTPTTGAYSMREIIDITDGNEFCFHLPYMIETNYLTTDNIMGRLDITIVNELRRPDNANASINLLFYVAAGPDFELACPMSANNGTSPAAFSPQMGRLRKQMDSGQCDVIVEGNIGSSDVPSYTSTFAEQSIGEMFTSIKQLLNRNTSLVSRTTINPASGLTIWPWFVNIPYNTSSGIIANSWGGDALTYFGPMFAFFRGSARISIASNQLATNYGGATQPANPSTMCVAGMQNPSLAGTVNSQISTTTYQPFNNSATEWITTGAATNGVTGVVMQNSNAGFTSWRLPYYAVTKFSLLIPQSTSALVPSDVSQPGNFLSVFSSLGFVDYALARSFSDDYQLSYFVGCPPVYVSST